ncbi:Nucleotidyl transferase domain-containing protein [Artemisia annua]|uniref:Nucleotidyl transferase domain-containing protein n=1 Tax=Artemisia annua TaxID=35608 RepID=A0A2U1MTW5_ARTAN|nr:Nucleotidyl transferase domain-containing protein [Artemisia annua]
MGEYEEWLGEGGEGGAGVMPNGLLPNAGRLLGSLDSVRWVKAEQRTEELIECIQPNKMSEERRNAVADYVQRLIMKCFPCQVFTFGSVPLKTYLPDGDIDLTAFSHNANLKDSWATEVRDMLETEEKNENAEFCVKEVQYIQAEVKIIKCLVENIVVDISFNQLGGLCTLCFLEEVDNLINHDHLFKRSIILIKAWCYYESRILGAHHGLISTYALETLVLYIFHVFNNSFTGPLEVLYRFLEFFSNFDWENFCVSLWGPVPISSLPDVTAEPPRKDSGELLLNKMFLDACSSVYAVFPGGLDNQGQAFVSKHFNVIDPLRVSNNLGRSVSKGNYFRIRSAFAYGAERLARLLDCPQENIVAEVNQFFTNTWDRHGSGIRPDVPGTNSLRANLSISNSQPVTDIPKINSRGKKSKEFSGRESESDDKRSQNSSRQPGTKAPRAQNQKGNGNVNKGQKNLKSGHLVNDIQRSPFARTQSSPELTDNYNDGPSQGRTNRAPESGKNQAVTSRKKNVEPEMPNSTPANQGFDASVDSNNGASLYQQREETSSTVGAHGMHQEEQDLVNMMASSGIHGFNGQVHMPMGHLPYPFPPSLLAGMGYAQRNFPNMVPANFPLFDPTFAGMQFPHGLVPPQLSHFFSGLGMTPNSEESIEPSNENFSVVEVSSADADHDSWREQNVGPTGGFEPDRVNSEKVTSTDKRQVSLAGLNYVPPARRVGGSGALLKSQKYNKEKRGPLRDDSDVVSERTASSRFSSAAHSNSLKSKTSSESSWDETSSVKKPTKEKRGKKPVLSAESSSGYVKGKTMFESTSTQQSEDDDQDSVRPPSMGSDTGSMHASRSHMPSYEPAQTSGSDSMVPMGPMILGHNSRQRMMDNSGATPLTFYPTGPPVPFLTMLPFYNVPSQPRPSDPSSSHFGDHDGMENGDLSHTFHAEIPDQSEDISSSSLRGPAPGGAPDERKSDILNSDFASHWQNLQFGRICQSPQQHGPTGYPSPVMVPPMYLQGRVPFDGPGRPVQNMNLVSQLMNHGPRLVPVAAPVQTVSNRPPNVYPHYVEDLPRHRSGTGTYLPNPKVAVRDHHPRRGNYNHDRTDNHIDRESNWNGNSKSRGSGRNHNRNQTNKQSSRFDRYGANDSRADRYQAQNGLHSVPSQSGPAGVAYGMYANPGGLSSNGSNGPSMVMMYPVEHNPGFASHNEQFEFGSLGPVGLSGVNEQSQVNDGSRARGTYEEHRLYGAPIQRSSPDRPSSPHHQRRV